MTGLKCVDKLWQKVLTPLSQGKLRKNQKRHKSQVLRLYHSASQYYCSCSQRKVKTAWFNWVINTFSFFSFFMVTYTSTGGNRQNNAYCVCHATEY